MALESCVLGMLYVSYTWLNFYFPNYVPVSVMGICLGPLFGFLFPGFLLAKPGFLDSFLVDTYNINATKGRTQFQRVRNV